MAEALAFQSICSDNLSQCKSRCLMCSGASQHSCPVLPEQVQLLLDDVLAGRPARAPLSTAGAVHAASPLSPSTAHALFATTVSSRGDSICVILDALWPLSDALCCYCSQPPLSPSKPRSPRPSLSPHRKSLTSSTSSLKRVGSSGS